MPLLSDHVTRTPIAHTIAAAALATVAVTGAAGGAETHDEARPVTQGHRTT